MRKDIWEFPRKKERIVAIIDERESQMNRKMNESLVREGIEEVLK